MSTSVVPNDHWTIWGPDGKMELVMDVEQCLTLDPPDISSDGQRDVGVRILCTTIQLLNLRKKTSWVDNA